MSHVVVGHVVNTYVTVSETFIPDAIAAVDAHGTESWVICGRSENEDRFPLPPPERRIVAPVPSTARRIVDRLRGADPRRRFAGSVLADARTAGPDLLHAHFGWSALYAAPLAQLMDIPLVTTFHGSDVTVLPLQPEHRGVYTGLFGTMTAAIVVSRYVQGALEDLGWAGPTHIVPAGVDVRRFTFREPPAACDAPRVAFVGRLVERKGADVLLRAAAGLRADGTPVEVHLVGDGPERSALEALAREHRLEEIRFHGALGPDGVRDVLRGAHLMVMPSRALPSGSGEGSPVVLKEALATGVPVIATDTGGTREVMPPEYRDELVAGDDVAGLAHQMRAVLHDPASWARRAHVGRAWVEQEFDWGVLGARTVELYATLAGDAERR
ncbi:glycosyltransferase family 4 protein [Baekduia soli]|uniref:Glycosyltransferase family 4 protein n=1 Tax=Baekduia soli TaxID=496014 RepID=A0A5B8U0V0_9ACTN|nr:glycosyltransferase family 4 protein [Baekduia soli]QEC46664.1 glycosyltransferase family 4 protein [Baekduia soli]